MAEPTPIIDPTAARAAAGAADKLTGSVRLLQTVLGLAANDGKKFSALLSFLPAPLKSIGEGLLGPLKGFGVLNEEMGIAGAVSTAAAGGVVTLAVAAAKLTLEVAAGAVKLGVWAVGLADSARSAGLSREAFVAMNPALKATSETFNALTEETGLGQSALMGLTQRLQAAGVQAGEMPAALRAAALAEKGLADSGGAQKFIQDITESKDRVLELSKAATDNLAPIVAQQMLGMDAQSEKLKGNIGGLFSGLDINPLLEGMKTLVGLFDQNSESGKAIKTIFQNLFQPLINMIPTVAKIFAALFGGFMKGASAILGPLSSVFAAVSKVFGFNDKSLNVVLFIAEGVGKRLGMIFGVIATVFGIVIANVAAFIGVFLAIPAALVALEGALTQLASIILDSLIGAFRSVVEFIGNLEILETISSVVSGIVPFLQEKAAEIIATFVGLFNTVVEFIGSIDFLGIAFNALNGIVVAVQQVGFSIIEGISGAFNSAIEFLRAIDFPQIGIDIMTGLASGITNAAGAVLNAITGAVQGAIGAAKSLLGISSPSKVFADIGVNTGEGFAGGVEAENDNAQAAMTALVEPPSGLAGAGSELAQAVSPADSGATAGSAAGGASPNFAGATFNFFGVKDAEHAKDLFGEMLTLALEGDAAALGAATNPTAEAA